MFDGKAFGESVVEIVKGYVEREVAPLKAENAELKSRLADLEARPAPEKGEKGDAGEPGRNGRDGADGQNGANGRGVKDLLIDREGQLIATMDDGEMKSLGPVCGKDGSPGEAGKDGRDGFGLDDFDVNPGDDGRSIIWSFKQGEQRFEVEMKHPLPIYRNVFKEGEQYEAGDLVTWGGSLWHCDTPTKDKPGTDSWTLAVKKGRDGKDAKNG